MDASDRILKDKYREILNERARILEEFTKAFLATMEGGPEENIQKIELCEQFQNTPGEVTLVWFFRRRRDQGEREFPAIEMEDEAIRQNYAESRITSPGVCEIKTSKVFEDGARWGWARAHK